MKFSDIFGHDKEIDILKKAAASGRVAHAYLFSGIDGIGKGLVAEALASALNCTAPVDGDSCGECESCRSMEGGSHLNLVKVAPEKGYLKIDQVREVQRAQRYKVAGGMRVVIIESADAMLVQPQNAFLKTLEEPAPSSVIVLISSRPAMLLPTIHSRCQRINFSPLPLKRLKEALMEREGITAEGAELLAGFGMGSFSKAREALESGVYESGIDYLDKLSALTATDACGLLALATALSKDDELHGVLEFIKTWLRDGAVRAEGAEHLAVMGGGSLGSPDSATSAGFDTFYSLFSMVDSAQRNIMAPRNASKLLTMEAMLMEFAAAKVEMNFGLAS
ncbi:MAG: DNA polymerase III subunit delta' [Thermodesulfobacteriota bacterium]